MNLTTSALNLRFLLRRQSPDPETWAGILWRKGICESKARALDVLKGAEIRGNELQVAFKCFDLGHPEELGAAPLFEQDGESVLKLNLEFLMSTLPHGWKRRLAHRLDIKQETISRWTTNGVPPEKKNIQGIIKFFGLPDDTNLREDPMFLSMSPLGVFAQKLWLQQRIEQTSGSEFGRVFPALEKIFRSDGTY
ncbi:hypothetical protein N8703_03230 [Verrucomicrobia bacterium]|nr:hypothetical protein [Verrucomicrobiota bacterium]